MLADDEEEPFVYTGHAMVDGSLVGQPGPWCQCGWSAVSRPSLEQPMRYVIFGPFPVHLPVQKKIKRAELYAVLSVLRLAPPPLVIHNHLALVEAIQRGRHWCVQSRRPHADLWRAVWHYLDELGPMHLCGPLQGTPLDGHYCRPSCRAAVCRSGQPRGRQVGEGGSSGGRRQGRWSSSFDRGSITSEVGN